jgi:putative endonuclease
MMGAHLNHSARRSKLAALSRGRRAERWASWWLLLKGYSILERRLALPGVGEIDLFARKGDVLAFVEVKRRASLAVAAAAIGPAQQRRQLRVAAAYLQRHPGLATLSPRFDAILLAPGRWPRHIIDAWRDPV